MSYSFTIACTSKTEAKQKIADEMDRVVAAQSSHTKDRDAAVACGHAFVDMLADPHPGDEISVSMHGSLSWHHGAEEFTSASVGVSAVLRSKAI